MSKSKLLNSEILDKVDSDNWTIALGCNCEVIISTYKDLLFTEVALYDLSVNECKILGEMFLSAVSNPKHDKVECGFGEWCLELNNNIIDITFDKLPIYGKIRLPILSVDDLRNLGEMFSSAVLTQY